MYKAYILPLLATGQDLAWQLVFVHAMTINVDGGSLALFGGMVLSGILLSNHPDTVDRRHPRSDVLAAFWLQYIVNSVIIN